MQHIKNSIALCAAAVAAASGQSLADDLLVGWDFSQFLLSGSTAVDVSNVDNRSIDSNFSDVGLSGTLSFDAFGPFTFSQNAAFATANAANVNREILSDARQNPDNVLFRLFFSEIGSALGFASSATKSVAGLSFEMIFPTTGYTPTMLSFAAARQDGGPTGITWSYDVGDGAVILTTTNIEVGDFQLIEVPLTGIEAIADKSEVRLIGTIQGGSTGNRISIDNVQVLGQAGSVAPFLSYWADATAEAGWSLTSTGYDGEAGIGAIVDESWPFIYIAGGEQQQLGWAEVIEGGDRNGFYAYIVNGEYWIFGINQVGWYYSFQPGNSGWKAFH